MRLHRAGYDAAPQRVVEGGGDPRAVGIHALAPHLSDDPREALVVLACLERPGVHLTAQLLEFLDEPLHGNGGHRCPPSPRGSSRVDVARKAAPIYRTRGRAATVALAPRLTASQ